MVDINQVYNEDCKETIKRFPDDYIDLVVTSPPYNVNLGNNKCHHSPYDEYNDNREHWEYINWLENVFSSLYRKMKSGGRICINIGDRKNGQIPVSSDVIQFMKNNSYLPISQIIWNKLTTSVRTAWGSFQSPSCPSFPKAFEFILIFAKESRKLQWKGETDLTRDEFINWTYAMWNFQPENRQSKIGHNAMFPPELPKRCIKMLSWIDSVVYDPFCGAGTTCMVAEKLKRNWIGSEISSNYCKIAEKRIAHAKEQKYLSEL